MRTAQGHAARGRRSLDTEGMQRAIGQVPPHKERALWNFLTWSFFIAQMLAADQLVGGKAQAAGDLDLPTSDAHVETVAPLSDSVMLAEAAGGTDPEEAVAVRSAGLPDAGAAALMKYGQFDGSAIGLEAAAAVQSEDVMQVGVISGSHVLAASEQVTADYVVPDIANDIHGGLLDVVDDTVDPLLDTVEDIVDALGDIVGDITDPLLGALDDIVESTVGPLLSTVESVVGSLDDTLDAVTDPLLATLGDVVPDAVADIGRNLHDVVESLSQPLDAALDLPPKVLEALVPPVATAVQVTQGATQAIQDVLASSGELAFPVLEIAGLDELYTDGRYTDYNLALQAKLPLPDLVAGDAGAAASNPVGDALTALSDAGDTELLDNIKDGLHLPHAAIPSVLEEIALRGLGDGIV